MGVGVNAAVTFVFTYRVPDYCDPNPCLNGGSCAVDIAGGHICSCTPGYGGMTCATDTSGKNRGYSARLRLLYLRLMGGFFN